MSWPPESAEMNMTFASKQAPLPGLTMGKKPDAGPMAMLLLMSKRETETFCATKSKLVMPVPSSSLRKMPPISVFKPGTMTIVVTMPLSGVSGSNG